MKTTNTLREQIRRLKKRVAKLSRDNAQLQQELNSLSRHWKNSTGIRGERFIHQLIKGSHLSIRGSAHDLQVAGKLIEIKTSECRCAVKRREGGSITKRWTWHRPLGASGDNRYDFLILVGDIDIRYRDRYRDQDKPAPRHVLFVIPKNRVRRIMRDSGQPIIQITTDPDNQRSRGGRLIWQYQKTRKELQRKFRT